MAGKLLSTKELVGLRVVSSKPSKKDPEATRKVGKVRACVFHPREKRFVGVIVKRPDAAMMFHRKDLFVAYNGYDMVDGRMQVRPEPEATDKAACQAMGINWDDCVLWVDMPVFTQDGTDLGYVGNIVFERASGAIRTLEVNAGATANTLLGKREIPADLIRGFRQGIGKQLSTFDENGEERMVGAILVDDAAKRISTEGGLAEKAGEATAIAGNKVHEVADNVVKPAADVAGKAVNKGAYVTGRQIVRARGMFSNFKSEYDKASGKAPATKKVAAGAAVAGSAVAAKAALEEEEYEIVYVDENGNVIEDDFELETADVFAEDDVEVVYVEEELEEELDDGVEVVYVDEDEDDEEYEVVYIDEDGNEVVYVDEDGNVVEVDEDGDFVIVTGEATW